MTRQPFSIATTLVPLGPQFSFGKTLRELPTAEILRYGLWATPPIIVGIYWLAIRGFALPIIFPLLTAAAVFYAVYPVECDRLRLLTKSFYYQDGRDLNVSAYLIIGVEVLFIILSAQMFSCDCSDDSDFWIPALFFLYLGFALLWVQTSGFREMEYGVRRYYFKASLFIGILYSAFVVYDSNNEFTEVWEAYDKAEASIRRVIDDVTPLDSKGDWWMTKAHTDVAIEDVKTLWDGFLTDGINTWNEAKGGNICAIFQFSNKLSNLVASTFVRPFSYVLMAMVNLNVLMGFVFSAYLLAATRAYMSAKMLIPKPEATT